MDAFELIFVEIFNVKTHSLSAFKQTSLYWCLLYQHVAIIFKSEMLGSLFG